MVTREVGKEQDMKRGIIKLFVTLLLVFSMMVLPLSAASSDDYGISPCYNHTSTAALSIGFDSSNNVHCGLSITIYSTGTGTSGLMRLYDSSGACLAEWPVSDYVDPISADFVYPGVYGERYTVTYEGYVYGNNMTAPDWISLQATDSNVYN